jgi:hypothetical protein
VGDRRGRRQPAYLTEDEERTFLITQPAYSRELNPVEHLWDDIREKESPNVLHASLDEVKQKNINTLVIQLAPLFAEMVKQSRAHLLPLVGPGSRYARTHER